LLVKKDSSFSPRKEIGLHLFHAFK
jgi:hypothetical protein